MDIIQDVTVVGCSFHPIAPNYLIYSFWLTDNKTCSTSILLIEGEHFLKLTKFQKINKKAEFINKCIYCNNNKCVLKNSTDLNSCVNKIFCSSRKYDRVDVNLRGIIKRNLNDYEDIHIIIKDISLDGIKCIITNQDINVNIGENIHIAICICDFIDECICKKCFKFNTLMDLALNGKIVWNIGNIYGINLESNNKNIFIMNEILTQIHQKMLCN